MHFLEIFLGSLIAWNPPDSNYRLLDSFLSADDGRITGKRSNSVLKVVQGSQILLARKTLFVVSPQKEAQESWAIKEPFLKRREKHSSKVKGKMQGKSKRSF